VKILIPLNLSIYNSLYSGTQQ